MAIKVSPQLEGNNQQRPERSDFKRRSLYSVRQDNSAPRRVRAASLQSYPVKEVARKRQLTTKSDRSKKHSTKRQTVVAVGWITQPISDEINRIATESGVSRSHTIAALLEEAVHQKLHQQQAAMIGPIIRDVLAKERDQDRKRMIELLVQNTVLTRQIMYLVTNVLTRIGATNPPTA